MVRAAAHALGREVEPLVEVELDAGRVGRAETANAAGRGGCVPLKGVLGHGAALRRKTPHLLDGGIGRRHGGRDGVGRQGRQRDVGIADMADIADVANIPNIVGVVRCGGIVALGQQLHGGRHGHGDVRHAAAAATVRDGGQVEGDVAAGRAAAMVARVLQAVHAAVVGTAALSIVVGRRRRGARRVGRVHGDGMGDAVLCALHDAHARQEAQHGLLPALAGHAALDVEQVREHGRQEDGDARRREVHLEAQTEHLAAHARDAVGRVAHARARELLLLDRQHGRAGRDGLDPRPVQRRHCRVIHQVKQGALDGNRGAAVLDIARRECGVPARRRQCQQPGAQLCIDLVDDARAVALAVVAHRAVGEQHHGAVVAVAAAVAAAAAAAARAVGADGILLLEHVADEDAQLRLLDTQLSELLLHVEIAHQTALGRQDVDLVWQYGLVKVAGHEHGNVGVFAADALGAAHAERDHAVAHKAAPPQQLAQTLAPHGLAGGARVAVQANGVGERDGNAHPVPGVLLVVGGLVPVGHEQEGLDEGEAVGLVVEVVQSPGLHEERLARLAAAAEAGCFEELGGHKGSGGEHDGMVQQQADGAVLAVAVVDGLEQRVQLEQRHVRVHKLDVGVQKGALQRDVGQREGALAVQVHNVLGGHLAGQRADEAGQEGSHLLLGVAELAIDRQEREAGEVQGRRGNGCNGDRVSGRRGVVAVVRVSVSIVVVRVVVAVVRVVVMVVVEAVIVVVAAAVALVEVHAGRGLGEQQRVVADALLGGKAKRSAVGAVGAAVTVGAVDAGAVELAERGFGVCECRVELAVQAIEVDAVDAVDAVTVGVDKVVLECLGAGKRARGLTCVE
ncbi:hypothetical protein F503_08844 [Ophiostoma piceae UAMH 11346]|uniref:Uncharacterized protein n=1 Tax=Ophiostoma piceae (strain UAMH 11346) TaxID=1262450 RepID=S3BR97_OPHP1|nr:hypothetical protein F503_08844 [Ophiostoma piceae UAMH 11346]